MAEALRKHSVEVDVEDNLDAFARLADGSYQLVIPNWTMGTITGEQLKPLLDAVRGGVGAAGVHGGMGDAFRQQCEYQFMVGGQWVAHPGGDGITYDVHIVDPDDPITRGMNDFTVTSEQYYVHVDPGNHVLATTNFGDVAVPVAWTKHYGEGRVFYCSLGHKAGIVSQEEVLPLVTNGMLWAAGRL
jgi:type 1 glutamine amidotransferase